MHRGRFPPLTFTVPMSLIRKFQHQLRAQGVMHRILEEKAKRQRLEDRAQVGSSPLSHCLLE